MALARIFLAKAVHVAAERRPQDAEAGRRVLAQPQRHPLAGFLGVAPAGAGGTVAAGVGPGCANLALRASRTSAILLPGGDMPVYPGDPPVKLEQVAPVGSDGFCDHCLTSAGHVGTHMDAPMHIVDGGAGIAAFPPEKFIGRGVLVDARKAASIGEGLLLDVALKPGDIVLVWTGHDARYREADYFTSFPQFTEAFARQLAGAGVAVVSMDTPSPDTAPYAIHKILLGRDVMIVENLTNLGALETAGDFEVSALPAKFEWDAAPVRVVAKVPAS
jgi:kynurenine formamidase